MLVLLSDYALREINRKTLSSEGAEEEGSSESGSSE